jgi:HPt (histidine-containing phosphotransfer) domain-containing protein
MSDPASEPPTLDIAVVAELVEMTGDPEFVRSLMDEFVVDAGGLVDSISTSAGDLPAGRGAVRADAHRLKSSAAIVGASALAEHAGRLETAADSSGTTDDDGVRLLAEGVVASASDAFAAIDRYKPGPLDRNGGQRPR